MGWYCCFLYCQIYIYIYILRHRLASLSVAMLELLLKYQELFLNIYRAITKIYVYMCHAFGCAAHDSQEAAAMPPFFSNSSMVNRKKWKWSRHHPELTGFLKSELSNFSGVSEAESVMMCDFVWWFLFPIGWPWDPFHTYFLAFLAWPLSFFSGCFRFFFSTGFDSCCSHRSIFDCRVCGRSTFPSPKPATYLMLVA